MRGDEIHQDAMFSYLIILIQTIRLLQSYILIVPNKYPVIDEAASVALRAPR